jgi:hypothetical protein
MGAELALVIFMKQHRPRAGLNGLTVVTIKIAAFWDLTK